MNRRIIKAKNEEVELYFRSIYSCSKYLNVNSGLIKNCCDQKNRVKRGKSKNDEKYYVFTYTEKPQDKEYTNIQKQIKIDKPLILCSICHHKYKFIDKHNKSKYHNKKLQDFDIDIEYKKILKHNKYMRK